MVQNSLRRDRFVNALSDTTRHVLNLSDYVLSYAESFVLSHGLNFGLPPRQLCKEKIFAEFESLWAQLLHHSASSVKQRTTLNRAGEPELRARELGFFEGAGALFSDVSGAGAGAGAGAIKIFGSSSSYPIMKKM